MKAALLFVVLAAFAGGQDQTGSIAGAVTDSVTHMPLKKAQVIVSSRTPGPVRGQPQPTPTDGSGAFGARDLAPGTYRVEGTHPRYPSPATASVEVKSGEAAHVSVELVPGASITGRVLDPDGDPIFGCMVQVLSPAGNNTRAGSAMGQEPTNENGEYRIWGVAAGRYILVAQCYQPVFEPRPFSAGPPKPPSLAYPAQFYPLASDIKSADIVELTPAMEKTGVDFHMRTAKVYTVRGTLTSMGADWKTRTDLQIMLVPKTAQRLNSGAGASIDRARGTFEASRVFPGSYTMVAATSGDSEGRIGGRRDVEVEDSDVEADLTLLPAVDIKGVVEIEGEKKIPLEQTTVQIMPADQRFFVPPSGARVSADGTFTLKSVLPSTWRVQVFAPQAYVKTVSLGDQESKDRVIDTASGGATSLHIVLGTKMGTIHGSGPPGQFVAVAADEGYGWQMVRGGAVTASGELTMANMAPGKYKLFLMDQPGPVPEAGGQEITVRVGETANVDLKPVTSRP